MNVYKGTFTANTGTGNQAVTGVGFTPKSLLVWTSYQTGTGFTDGYQLQIGMTDATRQASWAVIADDNTSPNDTDRAFSSTQLFLFRNVAGTNIRVGTIVSFDSNGFTVNWSTADANAVVIHFLAFGGADLSGAVSATNTSSPGATDLSAIDTFPWQAMLTMISVTSGDSCNGPCFGFAAQSLTSNSVTQGTSCAQVRDAQTTSITARYQRTIYSTAIISSTAQSVFTDQAWQYSGWFVNTSNSAVQLPLMWLGGIRAKAGSGLQPTSTGTQAITGLGFNPAAVIILSVGQTAQTAIQTEARFSMGASDGTSQGYGWCGDTHNVNPSVAAKGHSTTEIITCSTPNATGSSTSTEASASLTSLDADGFTLTWNAADATQREYIWIAFGSAAASAVGQITGARSIGTY